MARATRSNAQQEKDKPIEASPLSKKGGAKKRKRDSVAPTDEQPAVKQVRTDVKEEDLQEVEEGPVETDKVELPSSGDVPIKSDDAEKILDVLEMIDTQGLLDRVFPLPNDVLSTTESSSPESLLASSSSTQTFSLRALLKDSSQHPLCVLRSAVQHLLPISSHPRSRPSPPAAQQLKFCQLALSLLDKASFSSVPISLDTESILLECVPDQEDTKSSDVPFGSPLCRRKYALAQHLPTGSWFTSLNSTTADTAALASLSTGHAELVSVLPSSSASIAYTAPQTLGTYVRKLPPAQYRQPGPRRVSCGNFVDYGPYASFAPSFDQDGTEVGRETLGEVVWYQERERRLQVLAKGKQRALPNVVEPGDSDIQMMESVNGPGEIDVETGIGALLPPEEVAKIKAALGSLELEAQVQELLERNSRALQRLNKLQRQRLGAEDGGSSTVSEDSEEWAVAKVIMDSLTLLASLRPRSSEDNSSLVPFEKILRKLYCTLPVGPTDGWHGTLPEGRATALRDDITVKPGAPVPTVTTAAPVAPAIPATPTTAKPSTTYTPYSYSSYNPPPYRSGYSYGTSSSYYPNTSYATAQTNIQPSNTTHYPNAKYQSPAQPYAGYSSWYQYQPPAQPSAPASGRATPAPQPATPSYASFFAGTSGQRAVANTVAASKLYPAGWGAGGGQNAASPAAVTLPSHLRNIAAAPSTPRTGTPSTPSTGYAPVQASYYQPATPTARSA